MYSDKQSEDDYKSVQTQTSYIHSTSEFRYKEDIRPIPHILNLIKSSGIRFYVILNEQLIIFALK